MLQLNYCPPDAARVLLTPEQQEGPMPLTVITTVVLGYEVDNYSTYVQQITSYVDALLDIMTSIWLLVVAEGVAIGAFMGLVIGGPIGALIGAAIGAALGLVLLPILAAWAPADLIIHDVYVQSVGDISMLTDGNYPSPDPQAYTTDQGIEVLVANGMTPAQIVEEFSDLEEEDVRPASNAGRRLRWNRDGVAVLGEACVCLATIPQQAGL